jgi:hypothetical protein
LPRRWGDSARVESGSIKPFSSRRSELARSSASSQVRERRPKRGTRMAVLGKGLPPETHGHKPPETASDPQISPSWDVGQRVLATASFDGEKRAPSCFSSIAPTPSAVPPSSYHHSFPPPPPADAAEVVHKRSSSSNTFFYVHYSNCSPSYPLLFLLPSASTSFSRFFIALAQMTSALMSGSKKTSSAPSDLVSTTTATP